jgi:hypothetical protein
LTYIKTPAILAGVFVFMTEKKITYALNRIKTCKDNKYLLEALLRSYHLNVELLKFILESCSDEYSVKNQKVKVIIHEFLDEIDGNAKLKSIINKRSIKSVKPWMAKMDVFFKTLKLRQPSNIGALQQETEKIFGILKISTNKLFVKD